MSIQYQILCSAKSIVNGIMTITHIGGRNPLGEVWSLKADKAIEGIQTRKLGFFMNLGRQTFQIQISETGSGHTLNTAGTEKNLILDLPDCPV